MAAQTCILASDETVPSMKRLQVFGVTSELLTKVEQEEARRQIQRRHYSTEHSRSILSQITASLVSMRMPKRNEARSRHTCAVRHAHDSYLDTRQDLPCDTIVHQFLPQRQALLLQLLNQHHANIMQMRDISWGLLFAQPVQIEDISNYKPEALNVLSSPMICHLTASCAAGFSTWA